MTSEVGSGQVAIFPTFKGFRKAVDVEVDGSAKSANSRFVSTFKSAGSESGKGFAAGFRGSGSIDATVKSATAAVAAASREVSTARLREQDAAGKVRLAEAQLAEARSKYAGDSSQVVRAEERLASAERTVASAQSATLTSSNRLTSAQRELAAASTSAAASSERVGSSFRGLPAILGDAGSRSGSAFKSQLIGVLGGVVGGNILTGIGFTIGHLINDGIQTGIGVGLQSISLASDLNETTSAVRTVFGTAADDIVSFSKSADRALGQTQQQALLGAQTFGIFAKSAGLTGKPLSTFSTGLVTLAGDLASFYNTSPDDAIEALSAGLRGESEPLRRYGILLDDATLKQKAMSLGIYDGNGVLTQQQRILAAQAVIMQQSTIAQGDFARTSGGLANQQRIFQASLTDTETRLGTFFLPGANKFLAYANSTFLPQLETVIDKVGPKLSKAFDQAGPGAKKLLDHIGPLVDALADGASDAIPSFIKGMDDFVTAAPTWASAFKKVNDAGSDFVDWLDGGKGSSQQAIKDFFGSIGQGIQDGVKSSSFFDPKNFGFDTKGADAGNQFAASFMGVTTPAANAAGITAANDFGLGLVGNLPVATGQGAQLGGAGATGLSGTLPTWVSAGQGLGAAGLNALKPQVPEWVIYGQNFGQGLIDGSDSKVDAAAAAGARLGHAMSTATRRAMVISSPSKLAHSFGSFWGQGLVNGADSQQSNVAQSGRALAAALAKQSIPSAPAYAQSASLTARQASGGSPLGGATIDARQYVTTSPQQDPRIVGMQVGHEFLRTITGDAP